MLLTIFVGGAGACVESDGGKGLLAGEADSENAEAGGDGDVEGECDCDCNVAASGGDDVAGGTDDASDVGCGALRVEARAEVNTRASGTPSAATVA
jgi:hypothetical protein